MKNNDISQALTIIKQGLVKPKSLFVVNDDLNLKKREDAIISTDSVQFASLHSTISIESLSSTTAGLKFAYQAACTKSLSHTKVGRGNDLSMRILDDILSTFHLTFSQRFTSRPPNVPPHAFPTFHPTLPDFPPHSSQRPTSRPLNVPPHSSQSSTSRPPFERQPSSPFCSHRISQTATATFSHSRHMDETGIATRAYKLSGIGCRLVLRRFHFISVFNFSCRGWGIT